MKILYRNNKKYCILTISYLKIKIKENILEVQIFGYITRYQILELRMR